MSSSSAVVYRVCRHVLIGPALYAIGRPKIVGRENVPRTGAAIVAANHLAVIDSFYLTLAARRQVHFLAKSDYFTRGGIVGRLQKWFFTAMGQIPVDRTGGQSGVPVIPVAITGTRPEPDVRWWRRGRVVIEILPALDLSPFESAGDHRGATDALMQVLAGCSGQVYVDEYAKSWAEPPPDRDAA